LNKDELPINKTNHYEDEGGSAEFFPARFRILYGTAEFK
jgi:hypothetical protein